jgi:GTPase SAR1 family protein
MRRGRFFILGEGRVGKSSILRALMGEDFDPTLQSTEVRDGRTSYKD